MINIHYYKMRLLNFFFRFGVVGCGDSSGDVLGDGSGSLSGTKKSPSQPSTVLSSGAELASYLLLRA